MYGAGFGLMIPAVEDGRVNEAGAAQFLTGTLGVLVNDKDAQILYAGPAPGMVAGIVQVNLLIPKLPEGAYLAQNRLGTEIGSSRAHDAGKVAAGATVFVWIDTLARLEL